MGASKAKTPDLDDVDSGWEDDEDEDVDAGWEDPEDAEAPAAQGLTPEEREARATRAAARKERLRAKAAEKAERRRARASAAAAKQKKGAPRVAGAPSRRASERPPRPRVEEDEERAIEQPADPLPVLARRPPGPRFEWRRVVPFVVVLALAVGVALYLWKR